MPTNDPVALLNYLLAGATAETEWLEFKQNNSHPEEIARCISACANAAMLKEKDRAFIVWGIENDTHAKVGTTVQLAKLKKGAENLQNWLARVLEPRPMMEFLDFEEDGKPFSILAVEPTYDCPMRFLGDEYIRIGENVRQLKDFKEHARALWNATDRRKFESGIALSHQSIARVYDLLDVDGYYKLSREEKPQNREEIIRHFISCDFLRDDLEGGYDVTNLGAVLFAKDFAQFPSVAMKSIRVVRYIGKDKRKSEPEFNVTKGYAAGFVGLMQFILARLPSEEKYLGGVRRTVSPIPETAVREIVANALIHQDFTFTGAGPVVEIYDDRVEVTNPGNSLIAVDRIIDERRSRNEKLASAMRALGLCEERGSGIDKAIIDIEERNLPAPEFYASENAMRVILFGPKQFNQLSKGDKIWACFCHCVVRWIRRDYMSNTSLRERFSLGEDYQAVSDVISNAKKGGRIVPAEPEQGKRNAKYVPYWAR